MNISEFGQQNRFAALTPVASGQVNQGRSGGASGAAAATNVKDLPNDEIVYVVSLFVCIIIASLFSNYNACKIVHRG